MAVGGEQALPDQKSRAGDARADLGAPIGKADLIDAVNVANRVTVVIEYRGRHGLILLQLLDLSGEFVNLLLQVLRRRT
jgi:hypothetical protein